MMLHIPLFMTIMLAYVSLFGLTVLLFKYYRRYAMKFGIVDIPNHRSSHTKTTPRGGGIVFACLWLLAMGVVGYWNVLPRMECMILSVPLIVSVVGFLDDCRSVPAIWRLAAYSLAAFLIVWMMHGFDHLNIGIFTLHTTWFINSLVFISILWSTNAYNFMDGLDGLSAVEGSFVFLVGGLFLLHAGAWVLAALSMYVSVVVMSFLYWNWPPAKLFMGDAGSTFLGCLIMVFALLGQRWYGVPAWWWLGLYAAFLFDASVTLVRRVITGEKWYEAHRSHAVQRLYKAGWSERKIMMGLLATNILLAIFISTAVIYPAWSHEMILLCVISLIVLYWVIERKS